jgi:hypothetical protein
MNTPEIPPPPPLPSIPPVSFRGNGWRATIPAAVVIAIVTTVGTSVVSQLANPLTEIRAEQKRQADAIGRRLDAIEASQRAVLDRVEHDARDAANRDAIQDMRIEAVTRVR